MKKIFSLALAAALLMTALCACGSSSGGKQDKQVDLAAFAQTLQENHEFSMMIRNDPEDEELGAIMLDNYYPSLRDMDLEQIEVYLASNSFTSVELALVQAKNAEDAAAVKASFQARSDNMTAPGTYPTAAELWEQTAKVISNGSYVMLVAHEDSAAVVSEFNDLFK